jgi:hypothetical protein
VETDRPKVDPQTAPYAQRQQNVRLEVSIEGAKRLPARWRLAGLGGSFYVFQDGKGKGQQGGIPCRLAALLANMDDRYGG